MQRIKPSWVFNDQVEAAADFYVSVFPNSRIINKTYYAENEPGAAGSLATVTFEIMGERYVAANGGPYFTFSQGLSLYVNCDTQEEIDHLWEKLSEGGEKQMCGWVVDQFGVSWQIAPTILEDLMNDPDTEKAHRMMHAIYDMQKLDIRALLDAYEGRQLRRLQP